MAPIGVQLLAVSVMGLILMPGDGLAGDAGAKKQEFVVEFTAAPEVEVFGDELSEEETFSGRYLGVVTGDDAGIFADAEVACEFEGYAAPGRAFSCGFTNVEQVSGRCLFTAADGDSAIAEWQCRTGAMMTSDARCEGKVEWIDGTGRYAGITGGARFHSDLFLPGDGPGFAKWFGDWRVPAFAALTQ